MGKVDVADSPFEADRRADEFCLILKATMVSARTAVLKSPFVADHKAINGFTVGRALENLAWWEARTKTP